MKERKLPRLKNYDYGETGSYFITLCTQNRQPLFGIERELVGSDLCVAPTNPANQLIHKWIRETENKYRNISIDEYIIMSDHLHLLITIREYCEGFSLPHAMQFFKTMTTNEYIRGVKSGLFLPFDKKVWQSSYYDHISRNQQDYNETWEYIRNNPEAWHEKHGKP